MSASKHPDRRGAQSWLVATLAAATGVCAGAAGFCVVSQRGGSPNLGLVAGFVAGALAVVGLPSLSVRLVARSVLVASAGVIVRFGALTGSLTGGSQEILAWLAGAVTVFVLTDRIGTDAQADLGHPGGPSDGGRTTSGQQLPGPGTGEEPVARLGRARPARTARSALVAAAAVMTVALVLTPLVLPRMSQAASTGAAPRLPGTQDGSTVLRSTDSLDMTTRPDLTDEVMFRVTTDRPTFWRGETFDQWDGSRWSRSSEARYAVAGGQVLDGPDDLGATGADVFTQRIRLETTFSDVIYGAPTMVSVDTDRPLAQRLDGTLTTADAALGRGASYEVTSRRHPVSEEVLRAATGDVPGAVREQYASPPVITDRVREAALSVTDGAGTAYDKILALQAWMGARTEYSLDAPLSPRGVDVVDHFLFDARQGWCEQVASSLVVLARANGIPARLASGFVPDERDRVTGTYVVRARDAHAWTEVWFPDVGWVAFDPTANVPLAADARADASWGRWLLDHALIIALGAALVVAVGWPLWRLLRRRRARVRVDRSRSRSWAASADRRLVALGERASRPRAGGETTTAYALALAHRYREPGLSAVGETIDDASFAPAPPEVERTAAADQLLDELMTASVPVPVSAGVAQ